MRLYELLEGVCVIDCKVNLEKDVKYIFSDSRKAVEKGAFVAIKGENRNGNEYIIEAISKGVICIITDDISAFEINEHTILVENSRKALAFMWNNFYGKPTEVMKVVAITGTNGKTSCAYYLYNILKKAGKKRGLISTVECLVNDNTYETNGGSDVLDISSAMTTPDPEILYSIFYKMKNEGVKYVVMEASSHAIEQYKLSPLKFEITLFTNLSPEHLDFHKNMESYFETKSRLFDDSRVGIVNIDDEYGKKLHEKRTSTMTCSINEKADFLAKDISFLENGCNYIFEFKNIHEKIEVKIPASFSVSNSLMAISCASMLGIDIESIKLGILETNLIKGRMERIEKNIYIDYAHTPCATENVLLALKKLRPTGRLIALFGCGGDRDKGKRPIIGKICSEIADLCVITNDNPRCENPNEIIRDILKGIAPERNYIVVPKREEAIFFAVSQMKPDDILVLLGKGHENYEIDKGGKHYFDERVVVKRALFGDKREEI